MDKKPAQKASTPRQRHSGAAVSAVKTQARRQCHNSATDSRTCIDPKRAHKVIERYLEGDPTGLIHGLQDLQAEFGFVPCEAVELLCRRIGVPLSKAFSVATFYKAFSLQPKGDVIVRICTGTACHIRGAQTLVDELCTAFDIAPGETTEDFKLTIETVNCVGACAMAPVVSIDGHYHGNVQPGSLTRKLQGGK